MYFLMDFSRALDALKFGKTVSRKGWNGSDQYLVIVQPHEYNPSTQELPAGSNKSPWIAIMTTNHTISPWTPSTGDLFANDWVVVE